MTASINTAAVMTGTNWMTGIIFRGRSLGIDKDPTQDDKAVTTEAVHAASVFLQFGMWT